MKKRKPPAIKLTWKWEEKLLYWVATAPAKDYRGEGNYIITATQRPHYCDRGRWLVHVNTKTVSPLDDQEGFPRYFFNTEYMKEEMEAWVNTREECRNGNKTV